MMQPLQDFCSGFLSQHSKWRGGPGISALIRIMKIKERGNRILTGETTISKKFRYILLLMCVCIVFWLSALQVRAAAPVLSAKNLSVTVGHTRTLKLQNVSGKVTWSSSNAKTAVVSRCIAPA